MGAFTGSRRFDNKWIIVFCFTLLASIAEAQNVPVKVLWLRADEGINREGNRVRSWSDQSGKNRTASAPSSSRRPLYQLMGSNFNPTLYFDGSDNLDVLYHKDLNQKNFTVFTVHRLTGGNNSYRSPFTSRDDYPQKGYILYVAPNGKYQFWTGAGSNSGWQNLSTSRSASSRSELIVYKGQSKKKKLDKTAYVNGQVFAGPVSHNFAQNTRKPYRIGAGATEGSGTYFWHGDISEQIVFKTVLSDTQRQVTESYLAIKYGLSLGNNSQVFAYFKGNGTAVWDASSTYRYDISGLAKEISPFDLDQRISSSGNTDLSTSGNVVIATSNDFSASNLDNSRLVLADGQFLLWGHNNRGMNTWVDDGCAKRVNRFWRLQNTADVGTVFFQINLKSFPVSSTGNYSLFLDDDIDLSNGVISTHALAGNGDQYTTSFDPPSGKTYFTIGVKDDTPPVISNCPANIQACMEDVVSWTAPTANDNCGDATLTASETSGQTFPEGETTVIYTATDAAGNTSECRFIITVEPKPNPVGIYHE